MDAASRVGTAYSRPETASRGTYPSRPPAATLTECNFDGRQRPLLQQQGEAGGVSLSSGIQAQTARPARERHRSRRYGRRPGGPPRGWLEVAAEAVGSEGNVIGVDFQRIKDFEGPRQRGETLRGDMTEDKTRDRVIDAAGARSTSSSPTWHPTCPGSTRSIRPARCTSHDRPSRRPSNSSTAAGTSS